MLCCSFPQRSAPSQHIARSVGKLLLCFHQTLFFWHMEDSSSISNLSIELSSPYLNLILFLFQYYFHCSLLLRINLTRKIHMPICQSLTAKWSEKIFNQLKAISAGQAEKCPLTEKLQKLMYEPLYFLIFKFELNIKYFVPLIKTKARNQINQKNKNQLNQE